MRDVLLEILSARGNRSRNCRAASTTDRIVSSTWRVFCPSWDLCRPPRARRSSQRDLWWLFVCPSTTSALWTRVDWIGSFPELARCSCSACTRWDICARLLRCRSFSAIWPICRPLLCRLCHRPIFRLRSLMCFYPSNSHKQTCAKINSHYFLVT